MKNTSYRCPHLRKYTSAEGDASNASIADRGSLGREYEEHCILKYTSAEGDASNASITDRGSLGREYEEHCILMSAPEKICKCRGRPSNTSIADRGNLGREYEEHYIFAKIFYPEIDFMQVYILLGLDSIQNNGETGTKHIHRGWSEFWANMKNISYRCSYLRKYTDTEGDASNASIADRGNLGREYEEQYKFVLTIVAREYGTGCIRKAPADGIESGMGRPSVKVTADKKARANAASKAYYQKNAAVKAKRRRKDKPKSVVAQTIAMTHALGAQSLTSVNGSTKTGYNPTQETTDADADDEESSDEEHEPGERRRRAAAYPYTPSPSGGGSGRKWKGGKLRLATPASSSSPEPQGNLPSLYDKLGKARHQRKVPYDRLA
ncbi:hypothetical protein B0H17DRAFT_1151448 [Mycena rosella]|uniref:Uncharacterized protein n=1 Tax=Mycena rosella TaxID=1033263 RepID=A0AAD7BKT4_MYCRO|nr:hypothetical protein B0H17DRAFT_1151448 [Mycena rosella]